MNYIQLTVYPTMLLLSRLSENPNDLHVYSHGTESTNRSQILILPLLLLGYKAKVQNSVPVKVQRIQIFFSFNSTFGQLNHPSKHCYSNPCVNISPNNTWEHSVFSLHLHIPGLFPSSSTECPISWISENKIWGGFTVPKRQMGLDMMLT